MFSLHPGPTNLMHLLLRLAAARAASVTSASCQEAYGIMPSKVGRIPLYREAIPSSCTKAAWLMTSKITDKMLLSWHKSRDHHLEGLKFVVNNGMFTTNLIWLSLLHMSFRTRGPSELARRQRNNSDIVGSSGRFESKQKWGQKSGGFTKKNVAFNAFNYCNWIWWCFCFSHPFGTWDFDCLVWKKKGWEHSCLEVPSPPPSRSDDFSMQLHVSYPSAQPCELASCLTLVGWMFLAQKPLMLCRRFMSWYTLQGIHISHQTGKGKSSSKWTFSGDMSDMLVPRRVYDDIIMIILLQKFWYSLIHIYLIYSSLLAGS